MNTLQDVKLFHDFFGHPVLEVPTIPSDKRCELRVSLLVEEVKELKDAIDAQDIVEIADALADIQYVLSGAIHEFGLANLFPQIFAEVQRSNMSKACQTIEEAEATISEYSSAGTPCHYITKIDEDTATEFYIVVRNDNAKTLKSINYSPADLSFVKEV